jgi:hypothetical protein
MPAPSAILRRLPLAAAISFVLVVIATWALANFLKITAEWEFDDVHAYLAAAVRVQEEGALYITASDMSDLYLYAPWFAIAWIPIANLPVSTIEVAWAAVLAAATLLALVPFMRTVAGVALALLLGTLLYRAVGWGNVQPLIIALLVYAIPTRAGPWAVGLAASLKPWPILAVPVYLWRRQWRSAAIGLAVAGSLWSMALLFNWHDYPGGRGPTMYDATFLLVIPGLLRPDRFNPLAAVRARCR